MTCKYYGCSSLASIKLPDNLTGIGTSAFNSSGLTSVEIPISVTSIGDRAFSYCENMASVKVNWETPIQLTSYSIFVGSIYSTLTILYVPKGCINAYKNDFYWGQQFGKFAEHSSTDIEEIEKDTFSPHGVRNGIYNLNGQKQASPKKGINIIEGKKVMVK
jgi:hypothetical protein